MSRAAEVKKGSVTSSEVAGTGLNQLCLQKDTLSGPISVPETAAASIKLQSPRSVCEEFM